MFPKTELLLLFGLSSSSWTSRAVVNSGQQSVFRLFVLSEAVVMGLFEWFALQISDRIQYFHRNTDKISTEPRKLRWGKISKHFENTANQSTGCLTGVPYHPFFFGVCNFLLGFPEVLTPQTASTPEETWWTILYVFEHVFFQTCS